MFQNLTCRICYATFYFPLQSFYKHTRHKPFQKSKSPPRFFPNNFLNKTKWFFYQWHVSSLTCFASLNTKNPNEIDCIIMQHRIIGWEVCFQKWHFYLWTDFSKHTETMQRSLVECFNDYTDQDRKKFMSVTLDQSNAGLLA